MTGKVKGIMLSVVLVVIALLLIPLVVTSVHGVVTDSRTQVASGLTVAGNATTVTLTAGFGLYNGTLGEVTHITASDGGTPVAFGYVAGTRVLTIHGLTATTPQDLSVTYNYEANGTFTGVNAIVGLIPLLVVVGLIIVAIINGMWAMKKDN